MVAAGRADVGCGGCDDCNRGEILCFIQPIERNALHRELFAVDGPTHEVHDPKDTTPKLADFCKVRSRIPPGRGSHRDVLSFVGH